MERQTVPREDEDRVWNAHFGRPGRQVCDREGMPMATDSTLAARLEEQDIRAPDCSAEEDVYRYVLPLDLT